MVITLLMNIGSWNYTHYLEFYNESLEREGLRSVIYANSIHKIDVNDNIPFLSYIHLPDPLLR
jgi:hypothetical protein